VPLTAFDNLWLGIGREWPSYLGYATSFLTIGGIWLARAEARCHGSDLPEVQPRGEQVLDEHSRIERPSWREPVPLVARDRRRHVTPLSALDVLTSG
jgi:hypothetical protein